MLLNDESYYSMLHGKGGQGNNSKRLLKEKRDISMSLISAACILGALFGGLFIGVQLATLRSSYCNVTGTSASTPSFICPAEIFTNRSVPVMQETFDGSTAVVVRERSPFSAIKPAIIEIGVFALVQALGLRFLKVASSVVARKLPGLLSRTRPLAKLVTSARRVVQRSASGLFEATKMFYKKTAASKVVTRTKKIVKNIMYSKKKAHDGDDEEHH